MKDFSEPPLSQSHRANPEAAARIRLRRHNLTDERTFTWSNLALRLIGLDSRAHLDLKMLVNDYESNSEL